MPRPPNIVMVVLDQLRLDCIGRAGRYPARTPHIDRFAERATWFSHAFTPIPLCCPARQALLTGQRPESFGAHWNYDLGPTIPALEPSHDTWTRRYAEAGFAMSYVGKWHVSPDHDPTAFGFSDYVGEAEHAAFQAAKYPDVTYANGYFGEDDPVPLEDCRTHWLTRKAIEAIERHSASDAPWLVRLDLSEPHLPCRPARPFSTWFGPDDVPEWSSFRETFAQKPYIQRQQLVNWRVEDYAWRDWAPIVARYYNVIGQVDDAFGRVLAALDALGLDESTLVVFTADHGDLCGGHRMMDKHYVLYDDVVRVPLIVRMPGQTGARILDAFVSNMLDLGPTLLAAAGLPVPAGLHGRSLLPLLAGSPDAAPRDAVVATYNGQQFGLYSQRMIRTRRWKYVWNATDVDELYDLEADDAELTNLIGDPRHADLVATLRQDLHRRLKQEGDRLVDNQWLADQLLNSRKLPPAGAVGP